MYDPEAAEALLDEAGLPRGADGTKFEIALQHYEFFDVDYVQLAAAYWKEIGVDVDIDVTERSAHGELGGSASRLSSSIAAIGCNGPLGNLEMFIIPGLILGTALSAATMRMTRTMMLEVLRQDYIRTAWSKGLRERVVVIRHAIKNALIPVVTLIGLQLPILVGGAVIMENIFNLPGLGRLMLTALTDRD